MRLALLCVLVSVLAVPAGWGAARPAGSLSVENGRGSVVVTGKGIVIGRLDQGEVKPDHLDIGLAVHGHSRAGNRLWALGPLSKGRYWEIIAVPDIREQAADVAEDIALELQR